MKNDSLNKYSKNSKKIILTPVIFIFLISFTYAALSITPQNNITTRIDNNLI
jgi:hypothetical protein